MKVHLTLGSLFISCALFAAAADEELFLKPHLSDLAGKVVYEGGRLTSENQGTYDFASSVNVGKTLPSTLHYVTKDSKHEQGLNVHVRELAMSLKPNGVAIITAPASYGVIFTDSVTTPKAGLKEIYATLSKLGANSDSARIEKAVSNLKGINRATFVKRNGYLTLVTDEKMLVNGEKIWRKTPEGVEINAYHSEEEFLCAIQNAGLICQEVKRPCFFGESKWKAYNSSLKKDEKGLGVAYTDHNPFTLFVVKKA